jgi:large subunit ribosomal protein L4
MKLDIKDLSGKSVGSLELDDSVFGAEVKEHLLWEVVKSQRAAKRAGTHSVKRPSEVRGGGKKPFRQKGTGRARSGSTRSAQWVGGGSVFGPKPRSYEDHIPRKVVQAALRSALSLRVKEEKLVVVRDFGVGGKTKQLTAALKTLGLEKALIVDGASNETLSRAARNLVHSTAKTKFLATEGLNVYDVLDHPTLVMTEAAVQAITTRLKRAVSSADRKESK